MGLDHLLLREAVRRAADDRVQPVRHMGALVVCEDQEVQRSGRLLLPQVQGRAAVGAQKGHLELRESPDARFSLMPTAKNSLRHHLDGNCIATL